MVPILIPNFLISFLNTLDHCYLDLHRLQSYSSVYQVCSEDHRVMALRYCTASSRDCWMRTLRYNFDLHGLQSHIGYWMRTFHYGMRTFHYGMRTLRYRTACVASGYCCMATHSPQEAHSRAPGGLQSHVVRYFEGFAFPPPSALLLCAPSAFLNRYCLFVVVPLLVQGHLLSSH